MAKTTRRGVARNAQSAKRSASAKKKPVARAKAPKTVAEHIKAAASSKKKIIADKKAILKNLAARRPPQSEPIPINTVEELAETLETFVAELEEFAAHLRALDRRRLNGIGMRNQGFIENALSWAEVAPDFLPHWLTLARFQSDSQTYEALQALSKLNKQASELIWNLVIQSADILYTDALEYYASVREAAKRRVDAAESIFSDLFRFFRKYGSRVGTRETERQFKQSFNSMLAGKKEGKIVLENISPKLIGGRKKMIDETVKSKKFIESKADAEIIE